MEEKILEELKEIRKELQDIRSILEPKKMKEVKKNVNGLEVIYVSTE